MRYILMMLALIVVAFLYVKQSTRHTEPPAPIKEEFMAGFDSIFTMNCSQGDKERAAVCQCLLAEMLKSGAIRQSMEDLEKHQAKLAAFLQSDAGKIATAKCGELREPQPAEPPSVVF